MPINPFSVAPVEMWHSYIQIGESENDCAICFAGDLIHTEEESKKDGRRHCNPVFKKLIGRLPNGKWCICETDEDIEKCLKNKNNYPTPRFGYCPLFFNCGNFARLLLEKCCLKPDFSAPYFFSKFYYTTPIPSLWKCGAH